MQYGFIKPRLCNLLALFDKKMDFLDKENRVGVIYLDYCK